MKRALSIICILASTSPILAQVSPFDMSTERPVETTPAVPPTAQPSTVAPDSQAELPKPFKRFVIPSAGLTLSGESELRAWSIFLTPEQAESQSKFHIGYQNAVIIAPEASRLNVVVNGTTIVNNAIASSDTPADLAVDIPQGLLRAGLNDIAFEAVQRHRTDCTIQSTYELWTQIDSVRTFLSFESPDAGHWRRVEDLRAIGVNEMGVTHFNIIAPSSDQAAATTPLFRVSEALAILAGMPNQAFSVSANANDPPKPGMANIVVGPASTLADTISALPQGALAEPTVALLDDARLGPIVLVTGPDWQAVNVAIESLATQVDRPLSVQRSTLSTRLWRLPDTPLFTGAARLKLSDLGVVTQEFSGRRLRTDFSIGIPSDFYADAYGQAEILLDAAYTDEVLPGSHIDVYVNDNIAATYPINAGGGSILRHLPVKVTMRHFRPGDNKIAIEAVLMTPDDTVCAPGAPALDNQRFVLFDTSEFVMPNFARIGRTPDLAALSGTGFPYNRAEYALPVIVDRAQPEALSTAATLLARMSVAAGRLIPIDTTLSMAAVADRNALIVSPISQISAPILAQVGISPESRMNWGEVVASIKPDTQATFNEWRDRLSGSGWRGQIGRFEQWMSDTFDISLESFTILPGPLAPYDPPAGSNLLIAQQPSPSGDGLWTVVTSPSVTSLNMSMHTLVAQTNWRQLGGRISSFDETDEKVQTISSRQAAFIETQPFSVANYRLIVANWLSANAFAYSIVLTVLSILLGLATAGFLGSLGRRK